MTNFEWLKSLTAEQMADFLVSTSAELVGFCDSYCPESETCEGDCRYRDDKTMWREWLEAECAEDEEDQMGEELISRRAVMHAIDEALVGKGCSADGTMMARLINDYVIKKAPPAEPEKRTEERAETHGVCLDAISRQAAIKPPRKEN